MKSISIFTTLTSPEQRQDAYLEALECYLDFVDEVVVVNGGEGFKLFKRGFQHHKNWEDKAEVNNVISIAKIKEIKYKWPEEFDFCFIGQQFNRGYKACTGDWVIRADLDFFWHEDDFYAIRDFLKDCDAPVACMVKRQFLKHSSYSVKALVPVAFNKKKYGNRIQLDSGGDLCQPSLDGKEINKDEMPIIARKEYHIIDDSADPKLVSKRLEKAKTDEIGLYSYNDYIPVWNYECLKRTKEVQAKEFYRFARAWGRTFGKNLFNIQSEEDALREFLKMQVGRYKNSNQVKVKLEDHPRFIQETIKNLTSKQFGFDGWGNYEKNH